MAAGNPALPVLDGQGVAVPLTHAPGGDLTASETLIWAGQRLDPDSPLYNMSLAFDMEEALDVGCLQRALQTVVDQSDALRTVYGEAQGRPVRRVFPSIDAVLDVVDMTQPDVSSDGVQAFLLDRTQRAFDLGQRLTDVCLVRLANERSVLLINQHHIITDGWSASLLFSRLGAAYRAELCGASVSDRPTPQFAEHQSYEHRFVGTPELEKARVFWNHSATDRVKRMSLYGRVSSDSGRTQRVRERLTVEQTTALRSLGLTPPFRGLSSEQSGFNLLATVLATWLHRIGGDGELSVGVPLRNRRTAEAQDTLGLFIELYPLRLLIEEGDSFRAVGQKVAQSAMTMMRHAVPGACSTPGAQSFNAVLNYITAETSDFGGRTARADWVHSGYGDPAHAVRLQVYDFDGEGRLTLDFDLDEGTFGDTERAWAIQHFRTLLDAMIADADQAVSSVPVTTWEEEASFARRGVETPAPPGVLAMVRRHWDDAPESVALTEGSRSLSASQVSNQVDQIAAALRFRGIGAGDLVAICLPRSTDLVVSLLAVLRSGAAFVPLDPGDPDSKLKDVLSESAAVLGLVDADAPDRFGSLGGECTTLQTLVEEAPASADLPDGLPGPEDLAYVLFTSGSTGKPKGVEVSHRSLADYVAWATRAYADGKPTDFPLFTSPAFDLTLTSIFVPLVSGGRVVVYPESDEPPALTVRRVFEDDQVDVVKLTPSHLALIRDLDLKESRVRCLVVGGEALLTEVALGAHRAFSGDVEIVNEYGPTEATIGCMVHRFDAERDVGVSVPIGGPADNARIHILGPGGHPVPRGAPGELHIAGPRVARGYRNRSDLTAASFVTDARNPRSVMYKSGDWARWMPDGVVDFLGRRDAQVKLKGARVELGEIETALGAHPDIRGVAAYLVSSQRSSERRCRTCGLEAAHPQAHLDDKDECALCRRFEVERERIASYFGSLDQLRDILAVAKQDATGEQDCVMLLSGGKDSTYALCRIVELGARPLVFMLDNGFISDQAKENARRVTEMLDLELVLQAPKEMNEIFADSLNRFSNVCEGCFKTIYTLALNLAEERGIRTVVTGLSRGQIFETRLQDLYRRGIYDPAKVEKTILAARKIYHRMDDAVSDLLDVSAFETDAVLDRIQFVDFYRYADDSLAEVLTYIGEHTPWIRPSDTGRSTNCLINEAGIFVHTSERGFHNYSMPYSWDVRLGHKTRTDAIAELDDQLDPGRVHGILEEVSYTMRAPPPPESRLAACYVADADIPVPVLRRFLKTFLAPEAIPSAFVRLDELPTTAAGKLNRGALPQPASGRPLLEAAFVAPRTPAETALGDIWGEVLGLGSVGVHDNFFEIGGDSMHCIQIVSSAFEQGLAFTPRDLFAHPTVAELARIATEPVDKDTPGLATVDAAEMAELIDEFGEH